MLPEAAVINWWEYGSLIDKFFHMYDPRIIEITCIVWLKLSLSITYHLISQFNLFTESVKLHFFDLKLEFSLLFFPLEFQVFNEYDVLFHYMSE